MPSNALSKRRGPLRRPKECDTPTNPGRCEDPPEPPLFVCDIYFSEGDLPVYTSESYQLNWSACHQDVSKEYMLLPMVMATLGVITDIESAENCTDGNAVAYDSPEDPGDETIYYVVAWPTGHYCWEVLQFPVTEEP